MEIKRGAQQVMQATGVCDMRSILTVRKAFHLVPQHSHSVEDVSRAQNEDDEWLDAWTVERTDSDGEDEGGEEGLAKNTDKPRLRMQRSFELLLKSGHVVRFEVSFLVLPFDFFLTTLVYRPIRATRLLNGSNASTIS
jgi:hypothetical protein